MAHDDQQGCQQAENRQRQRFVEKEHGNGHQDGRYDGTEGDDARQGDDDGPDAEDDKRFPRGQEQDDAQARGDAFAAFELEENRARMADDGQQAAGDHEVDLRVRTAQARLAGDLAEVDAEHPLGDIANEDQQAADGAEDAVGVGRPRVMAAVVPDIRMIQGLADDQTAWEGPGDIGQYQAEDSEHHKLSPSFFPRRMSRIGVPSKPKVSRRRFSRKRRYEKCMSCGSLTKRMNVGGWTEAWVM